MEDGEGLDGAVEIFGEEVPEDLGPEETLKGGGALVDGGCEDDEAGPVVLDELAHGGEGVVEGVGEWLRAGSTRVLFVGRQSRETALSSSEVSMSPAGHGRRCVDGPRTMTWVAMLCLMDRIWHLNLQQAVSTEGMLKRAG